MTDRATAILDLVRNSEDSALSAFLIAVKVGLPSSTVRHIVREELNAHVRLQDDDLVVLNSSPIHVHTRPPAPARPPPTREALPKARTDSAASSRRTVIPDFFRSYLEQQKLKTEARELSLVADKSFAECLPTDLRRKLGW